jgi:hypothetical protein
VKKKGTGTSMGKDERNGDKHHGIALGIHHQSMEQGGQGTFLMKTALLWMNMRWRKHVARKQNANLMVASAASADEGDLTKHGKCRNRGFWKCVAPSKIN